MTATNLADSYELPVLDWATLVLDFEAGIPQAPGDGGPDRHTCWLTTINRDGSPHVTGIGALWVDGTFWFETGKKSRKARNLARDPRCALSVATHEFDLVVEGTAAQVTDPRRSPQWQPGGQRFDEWWPSAVADPAEVAATCSPSDTAPQSPPIDRPALTLTGCSQVACNAGFERCAHPCPGHGDRPTSSPARAPLMEQALSRFRASWA